MTGAFEINWIAASRVGECQPSPAGRARTAQSDEIAVRSTSIGHASLGKVHPVDHGLGQRRFAPIRTTRSANW